MSKNLTAATGTQGISVPSTLPKQAVLVNKIQRLLENEAITPLGVASEHFDQLEAIFDSICHAVEQIAKGDTGGASLSASLRRVTLLARSGSYQASHISDLTDISHEKLRDIHAPAIVAMMRGES